MWRVTGPARWPRRAGAVAGDWPGASEAACAVAGDWPQWPGASAGAVAGDWPGASAGASVCCRLLALRAGPVTRLTETALSD